MKQFLAFVFLLCSLLSFTACSPQIMKCTAPDETPEFRFVSGMKALDQRRYDAASDYFGKAVECDPGYSPAYGGLAIAAVQSSAVSPDPEIRRNNAGVASGYLKKSEKHAKGAGERFAVLIARMRVHTAVREKRWLESVEEIYRNARSMKVSDDAIPWYQGKEAAEYYMGAAYFAENRFSDARDRFAAVINAKSTGVMHAAADREWKRTDRIIRALAGVTVGDAGRAIAVKSSVTKGDMAVLLVNELGVDGLFSARIGSGRNPEFEPADVLNHPQKGAILNLMKWQVRGLEPAYDERTRAFLFSPESPVKRGELAFTIEDVLVKVTGAESIATAFFGHDRSPFRDVSPTSPLYNAVMNVTTRGIMEADLDGAFRPNDPADGADAVLAVRVLKQRMQNR